jgi:hypothetical protein
MSSGQVEIFNEYNKNCPVYLYTHNGGDKLVNIVYEVLSMQTRWDDSDYLTRLIFCAMVPNNRWNDEYGYGIGTGLYDDIDILVSIDVPNQKIKLQSSIDIHNYQSMSFTEFIDNFYNSAEL